MSLWTREALNHALNLLIHNSISTQPSYIVYLMLVKLREEKNRIYLIYFCSLAKKQLKETNKEHHPAQAGIMGRVLEIQISQGVKEWAGRTGT